MFLDLPWTPVLLGLLVGLPMGYVARATHFCTMAALERHWFASDSRGLRSWVLAALTALTATQLLSAAGLVSTSESFYLTEPFSLAGIILGGIMFGIGMALVGTCGFGAVIRLGGGNLRALVVLIGLGLAALAAQRGLTGWLRIETIDRFAIDLAPLGGQSAGALLSRSLGRDVTLPFTALIVIVGMAWVWKSPEFRKDMPRIVSGLVIGLCVAAGWVATSAVNSHAMTTIQIEAGSFVMPVGDAILQMITFTGIWPDYGVGLIFGVLAGAIAAAWRSDDMRWEACDDARELSRHLIGAFLMGTGGVFALGCTIGQGVSAFSVLAISSPLAIASIALGARMGLDFLLEGRVFGFAIGRES